jgi:hypothetical protein
MSMPLVAAEGRAAIHCADRSSGTVSRVLGICLVLALTTPARAVPYSVRPDPHPFDSDWPAVSLILAEKCAGCHRTNTERTDLTSYESVMAATYCEEPIVVPRSPDVSSLLEAVAWDTGQADHSRYSQTPEMPPKAEEWLTAGQIETIRRWIANGAHEYCSDTCESRPLIETDFPSAKQCGQCHPKQFREWSRSMHAYAQHSPVFEAFNLTLIERTGGTIGTFCTRCHTQVGTALGENGSRRNVHRARVSMEGVTCVACHRRKHRSYKASARLAIEPGTLNEACIFGPFDNPVSMDLSAHAASPQPYIKSSQFCGECHDVTIPGGVRLEEAFSEWQNSPAAAAGVTCQQCHMGPDQGLPIPDGERPLGYAAVVPGVDPASLPLRHLTDHTFAGPDYSLLPDTEFPHKLDWMYENDYRDEASLTAYQRRTLTDLRKRNRRQLRIADVKRRELLRNSACISVGHPSEAKSGDHVKLRVDVQSKLAGHNLPTGFTAERQVWISVTVCDPSGEVIFTSGDLDANGDLRDGHSRAVLAGRVPYDRHLLNLQSKFVSLSHRGTERFVVLPVNRNLEPLNVLRPANGISVTFGHPVDFRIAKGSLPPNQSFGRTYAVPLRQRGQYTVHAALNFRHLPPTLLDHIGVPHLKHLLEIVVIDEYHSVIYVR